MEFYRGNRRKWNEFYPSERWVFEKLVSEKGTLGKVLDVGCACGGLGEALSERSLIECYTGVDINGDAIEWASREIRLPVPLEFIAEDILKLDRNDQFDTVVSLSCADWNIETSKIIEACWKRVKLGGTLIISLRVTPEKGVNNIKKSYQYINFFGNEKDPEIANYVVLNFQETLQLLGDLKPSPQVIGAYGYWGKHSSMAMTPYEQIVFAVFYVKKSLTKTSQHIIMTEFNLPLNIY